MKRRFQRMVKRDAASVDVTAFLSLMVILVPFLLVTAVFSRMTILEVLPLSGRDSAALPDPLELRVTVRREVIEVTHAGREQAVQLKRTSDGGALAALAALAEQLKARHPQSLEATVLVEPQVSYERVVQVLDVLRVGWEPNAAGVGQTELFPLIALGPVAQPGQRGAP